MQLPVNIPDVLKIATDMKEVASTPIAVSIYIDDTAPGALVGHVRQAFSSAGEHTRVTIDYLDEDPIVVKRNEDMGVIIAGSSERIGEEAERLREAGVPAMVVTNDPEAVSSRAHDSGFPIPGADIIAPIRLEAQITAKVLSKVPFLKGMNAPVVKEPSTGAIDGEIVVDAEEAKAVGSDADVPEVPLNDETFAILDARMGKWVVEACKEKDLAFALSFPFIRRPLAEDSITATSLQNGAIGLVPVLPGADMPIMTLNQVKMALQIATAYGQPMDADRIKELACVVAGAFLCRNVVRSMTKAIPFAGWAISGTMGFAATEAMGHALMEYFEAGGDMVGVASVIQTTRDKAIDVSKKAAASPQGRKIASKVKDLAIEIAPKSS